MAGEVGDCQEEAVAEGAEGEGEHRLRTRAPAPIREGPHLGDAGETDAGEERERGKGARSCG